MSAKHCIGALALLWGCAERLEHAEQLSTEAQQQIATDSDFSGVADSPAAQIAPGASAACPSGSTRLPASGLRIREIALYQTIKIPLVQNGAWVTARPAIVVQNKRALVRVFVDAVAGYRQRPLRGALTLQNGATITELVSARTLAGSSTDEAADSTFTFDVPAAQIGPSTQLSVALSEPECGAASTAAAEAGTRFPASGRQALGANATGRLKVVLVPISVGGRAPTLAERDITGIRDVLLSYFPVPAVDVSVRSRPLVWSGAAGASDSRSWSSIVNALVRERSTDRPSSDTYYFGLMQPAPTMAAYCARGCIAGMAPQNTRVQPGTQVGLGVYFADTAPALNRAAEIIVHELGHAHGRGHAPCVNSGGNISGVDRNYPAAGGATGIWGWNSRTGALTAPTHKDVMGYCQPNWISAYTYQALAVRSQAVNINRAFIHMPSPATRWQSLLAYSDGSARWGGSAEIGPPGGDPEPARVLNAAGQVIANIEVVRTELSHTEDEFFYVPEPGKDWVKLALRDREIALAAVAPPL